MSHVQHVPQSVSALQSRDSGPVGTPMCHHADSERTCWTIRGTAEQIPHLFCLNSLNPLSDEEKQRQENNLQASSTASSSASQSSLIHLWTQKCWRFFSPVRWRPCRIALFSCSDSLGFSKSFLLDLQFPFLFSGVSALCFCPRTQSIFFQTTVKTSGLHQ